MTDPQADGRQGRTEAAEVPLLPDGALDGDGGTPEIDSGGPSTEQLRIAAIQAVVAAGLAPSTGRQQQAEEEALVASTPLPDWTDPPTGQVPRVLLDPDRQDEEGTERTMKGPVWRQDAADWEEGADLGIAFLLDEEGEDPDAPVVAGRERFSFEDELFAELDAVAPARFEWPDAREEEEAPGRPRLARYTGRRL